MTNLVISIPQILEMFPSRKNWDGKQASQFLAAYTREKVIHAKFGKLGNITHQRNSTLLHTYFGICCRVPLFSLVMNTLYTFCFVAPN